MLRVAIDPGHGGRDPGGVGFLKEVDVVYPWAASLFVALQQRGILAGFTHAPPGPTKKVSLCKRVRAAHQMRADLYISVHANSWETPKPSGAEVLVYSSTSQSKDWADAILPALTEGVGQHGQGLWYRPKLYVLKRTQCPAVLLEVGFVTCPADADWLAHNTQAQASRVAEAIWSHAVEIGWTT